MIKERLKQVNYQFSGSFFLFKRSRSSGSDTEELFGEREDLLRKVDGQWKITSRVVYPDQAVLTVMNLSMFL